MSAIGLLYVGAVLFVNGMMLLGHISGRGAAPLNIFVGALQVVIPTYLALSAKGDVLQLAEAGGLYFFGFTYLWLGLNLVTGWPDHGLGWFCGSSHLSVESCSSMDLGASACLPEAPGQNT